MSEEENQISLQEEIEKQIQTAAEPKEYFNEMNVIGKENDEKEDEAEEETQEEERRVQFSFDEENDEEEFDIEYDSEDYDFNEGNESKEEDIDRKEEEKPQNIDLDEEIKEKTDSKPVYQNSSSFYEKDEDDYLDPHDPNLHMSRNDEGVSTEELFGDQPKAEKKEDDEDIDLSVLQPKDKKKYEDVQEAYKSGRLNKNNMIFALVGFCLVFAVAIGIISSNKKKEAELAKSEKENKVSVNGYSPDFGNYKARVKKNVPAESEKSISKEDQEAIDKINKILVEGNKEPYQEKQAYNPNTTYSYSSSQQSAANTSYEDKVNSPIRFSGDGFGHKRSGEEVYYEGYPQGNNGYPYNTGYGNGGNGLNFDSSGYFDNLNQVMDKMGVKNQSQDKVNNGRYTQAGAYDRNAEGGDAHSIPSNSIYPGTIIPAVMINGINTDYPGTITARVINNVYDSRTGQVLLIPAGSIVRGSYSSSSIGVARVQIAWQQLIINRDGMDYYVNLGSMVGVDKSGYSGIKGTLSEHAFQYVKAAGISSMFTYINSNIYEVTKAQKSKTTQEMIANSQDIGNKLADRIMERALDIQPTVRVRPGTRVSIDVDKIITLVPYERDVPKEKYIRK